MPLKGSMSDFDIVLRLAIINDIYTSSKRVLTRIKHFRGVASPEMLEKLNLIYYSKYPKMAINMVVQNFEVGTNGRKVKHT